MGLIRNVGGGGTEAPRPWWLWIEILRLPTEAASIQATTELLDDLPQGSGVLLDGPQCFP